ncbi:hypothetical protein [Nicoliella lavandulae]|uniref:Uncharacterized protein n=1 Tax=Nicoliella lavandulae TaxID=3082954 RepID=A0ABU8SJI1_9LACO
MQNKNLNIGASCSLLVFVLINVMMWLGSSLITGAGLLRAIIIAAVLYFIPMLLAYWRVQVAYHILGLIMIFYTLSFITSVTLITDGSISLWLRIVNLCLGIFGIFINVVWFRLVFNNSKRRVAEKLKQQQKDK